MRHRLITQVKDTLGGPGLGLGTLAISVISEGESLKSFSQKARFSFMCVTFLALGFTTSPRGELQDAWVPAFQATCLADKTIARGFVRGSCRDYQQRE